MNEADEYTHEDYRRLMISLYLVGDMLLKMPLDGLLRAQEHAETFGPLLDPTLYREKGRELGEDKSIVQAALAFKTSIEALRDRCARTRKVADAD